MADTRTPVAIDGLLFAPGDRPLFGISRGPNARKADSLSGWIFESQEDAERELPRYPRGSCVCMLETRADRARWDAQQGIDWDAQWCDTPTGAVLRAAADS